MNSKPIDFPKEWEFKRTYENAEDILMGRKLRNPDQQCPFNISDVIAKMKRNFPYTTNEKLFGTMFVILKNKWYDEYAEKTEKKTAAAAPPESMR